LGPEFQKVSSRIQENSRFLETRLGDRRINPLRAERGSALGRVEQPTSQSELADKLGVSFQQVQKYEKGVNRVGASRLQQIATALDVPATFFYDDDDLGKRAGDGKREVESLLFIDSAFSLRLLRAYSKVPQPVARKRRE
jgi:transcriptional regulator with XRE-family HTH domain